MAGEFKLAGKSSKSEKAYCFFRPASTVEKLHSMFL